jgi:hypothetical protein
VPNRSDSTTAPPSAHTAAIKGTLIFVGGPAPGLPVPAGGVVSVRQNGRVVRQATVAYGTFEFDVPPGVYELDGTSGIPCNPQTINAVSGTTTVVRVRCGGD